MRLLADTMNLSAGALYRYFPTKQAVLMAYCLDEIEGLTRNCERIVGEERDPVRALERMLLAYADFALDDPGRFRVLFLDPEVTKLQFDDPRGLEAYDLILKSVARAQEAGLLRSLPPADGARVLLASVHGVCVLAATVREIDFSDARSLVVESVRNALRGLSACGEGV